MSPIVPDIFIMLSAVALLLALIALWQSLRGLFSQESWSVSVDASDDYPDRKSVAFERQRLQQSIEDIANERDMGKLSQSDFETLDRTLRAREKEMLELLDAGEQSIREQARRLIEDYVTRPIDRDEPRDENRVVAPKSCESCGAANDSDARYCKRCGNKLDGEVEA